MEEAPARQPTAPRFRARPRDAWFLVIAVAVVALDQAVKWLIRSTLDRGEVWPADWPIKIVHITNSGAAFGILQDSGPLLAVTSLIGMAAILVYLFNPEFAHPLMRAGLALMLGGAVGNLIDRVRDGRVVDFIKVPNWPAFNVADSAITIGVCLLIWTMLFEDKEPSTGEST